MTQGIDMSKSGWENPDGLKQREHTERAPAPDPVCEDAGPDGWVCDLSPSHRGDVHRADGGPTWPRKLAAGGIVRGPIVGEHDGAALQQERFASDLLAEIHHLVLGAMEDQRPTTWAVALKAIEEMTRGY